MSMPTNETPERQAFYDRISRQNMTPLWLSLSRLVTHEPESACQPATWSFDDIRAAMLEAGNLITAKEAERRVLILENPGLRGQSKITTDLYAGVQLVMPGEVAPAHRHTQSALRFVLEDGGGRAHTSVNGERTTMRYGDFILTPPMTWHDHGNESDQPIFWLDGLDIPVVQFLDASFSEHHDRDEQPIARPAGDARARYGSNLLPLTPHRAASSPIFNYEYAPTREALAQLAKSQDYDPCHGIKMRYNNPATGGYPLSTIAAFIQLLPRGFKTARYRGTDATIFVAVEGSGKTTIGDFTVNWQPRDIFVVPSWKTVVHEATDESVLFSFSDRAIQEALHLFREELISEPRR